MNQLFKTIATPLHSVFRDLADPLKTRRQMRRFRKWSDQDEKRLDFYRQFVAAGDIVFDVGANLGNRAKIFSKLGATVVAIEPQGECADFLRMAFRHAANFHLVRKALGASPGQAEMLVCNAHTISSLSPEWVRRVKESGRFEDYEWDRTEAVQIDTLDNLIAEYGRPAFIKIDVEGFEDQVVAGLSTPVRAISLEFAPEYIEGTHRCIEHLCRIGECRFQVSLGESMEFLLPNWVTAEEVRSTLAEMPPMAFGDLYARLA
ncbi:MAG: FkbM family methyltransferase [Pirellulaceae bacterium]|nr:FkbM family methyltransferase [Pirellulaceae bacterium]